MTHGGGRDAECDGHFLAPFANFAVVSLVLLVVSTTDTWHEVIDEPTFADAILDRIVHNAYRLALDGPSMRKIQAAEMEAAVPIVDTTSSTSATTAKFPKGAKK